MTKFSTLMALVASMGGCPGGLTPRDPGDLDDTIDEVDDNTDTDEGDTDQVDDTDDAPIPEFTDFILDDITSGVFVPGPRYVTGQGVPAVSMRNDAAPGFGEVYDTQFNTRIRRLNEGRIGNHVYSQLQAFSADNSYVLMMEGANPNNVRMVVKRLQDMEIVLAEPDVGAWQVVKWHPTEPTKLVHFNGYSQNNMRLQITDVVTGATDNVFSFPSAYRDVMSNQTFDEISRDGEWFGGMGLTGGNDARIYSFNLENMEIGAELSINDLYAGPCSNSSWNVDPDWVGVSPLGNYLVVQWAGAQLGRCNGMETFDIATGEYLGRVTLEHPHGDLQVLDDGVTEVFVSVELSGPGPNKSYADGTPGGTAAELDSPAFSYRTLPGTPNGQSAPQHLYLTDWILDHISCRGPAGWCLVTAANNPLNGSWDPLEEELFLMKLDGSGIVRIGHHRSNPDLQPSNDEYYWAQPRASFSGDGRYVIFDTNWSTAPDTNAMIIDLAETP